MRLGRSPNWSIQRVLWLCFLPLIIILAVMALIFGLQINQIDQDVTQVADVQGPLETAVLEMRIAAGDIEQAVSDYIGDRDATHAYQV